MGMRIVQLSTAIANQIAAGEVIERPASVVKELLENSLDAGASAIDIETNYGGLNQIKISDNGFGIMAEDLSLAVAAHATSKITTLDDLYAIRSMGFRGEALASIASIAKLSISSKTKEQEHAMMLTTQGAKQAISPCARSVGTTIEVCDLFFNAPVRKRFLKSERLEFQAIEGVVKRFALSAPHIAISLHHNSKHIFSLPSALNEQTRKVRMTKIFGSSFVEHAVFLDVDQGGMRLCGWVSGVGHQRSQNDRQWVYINQRMVKDKLINHALKQAYDGLLHPGRFPSCLLYFTINTDEVDVNVHPTKHEVRFQQPRLVHDFFIAQLTKALKTQVPDLTELPEQYNSLCEPQPQFKKAELRRVDFNSQAVRTASPVSNHGAKNDGTEERPWTILNKQYSLLWVEQQPYLVDVAALYSSWLRQHLTTESSPLASRPLLVSIRYPLSVTMKQRFDELALCVRALGIALDALNDDLVIRSIPVCSPYLDLKVFFASLDELDFYSLEQVQEHMVQAQAIDVQQLSPDERMALSHYLIHTQNNETPLSLAFKPLTVEACRMLLCHL
jgi:DNA mismatch repair protein MutL